MEMINTQYDKTLNEIMVLSKLYNHSTITSTYNFNQTPWITKTKYQMHIANPITGQKQGTCFFIYHEIPISICTDSGIFFFLNVFTSVG